jgi:hypothetical protein
VSDDEIPKLEDWLTEFGGRPRRVEIVVAVYELDEPVSDERVHDIPVGQTGVHVVRYDDPRKPPDIDGVHYVMAVNADGSHIWDDWFESLKGALQAIVAGDYGALRLRGA